MVVGSANFTVKFFVCSSSVRKLAAKNGEEQDTYSPYVGRRSAVFSLAHDLRSHVGRSSAEDFDLLVVWDAGRESEVYNFDVLLRIKQQIFKLDVSVSDAPGVAIPEPLSDLSDDSFGILLVKPSVWLRLEVAVERATFNVVHDQYDILVGVDDLVESDDVFVLHSFHQFYLSFHRLSPILVLKLVLLIYFKRYFSVKGFVKANPNYRVRTLANLLADDIFV